jgi:hypothetical protein
LVLPGAAIGAHGRNYERKMKEEQKQGGDSVIIRTK